jgi:GTP pyrophosphokinase
LKIVNRQADFIEALVDVDVRDVAHLSKVIAGLRGAIGVRGVERG